MSRRSKSAMDEQDLKAKIGAAVDGWFTGDIHGSPVSRSTEAYNHLHRSLASLKDRLFADLAGIVPAPAATEE